MSLIPLETMAAEIDAANPAGLAAFLRDGFGDPDEANVNGSRLEIAGGASLAAAGIPFHFGGRGQPDFAFAFADAEGFLEVTREPMDDFQKLWAAVERQLLEEGLDVLVTYRVQDWQLRVRARNPLQTRIIEAARRAAVDAGPQRALLDALEPGASPECRVRQPGELGTSFIAHGGSIEPGPAYLADLASKVRRVLEEKEAQSRRGRWSPNTMVLIDISAAHQALLLGDDALHAWFNTIDWDWEDMPFLAVAVGFTNWHRVGSPALYRMRPGVIGEQAEVIAIAAAKLGLKSADVE